MFYFKSQDRYHAIYMSNVARLYEEAIADCVCVFVLTHLRLCSEIGCDKVGGKQSDSLVCFPLPPVWVTEITKKQKHFINEQNLHPLSLSFSSSSTDISTQRSLGINVHICSCSVGKLESHLSSKMVMISPDLKVSSLSSAASKS